MKNFNHHFFIFIFLILIMPNIEAKEEKEDRSFSFSSGYLDKSLPSNESLLYFPLSANQLYGQGYDSLTGSFASSSGLRALSLLISLPISYWYANALYVSFHEFGHGRAFSALKSKDYRYSVYYQDKRGINNYWELYFWLLLSPPTDFSGDPISASTYTYSPLAALPRDHFGLNGNNIVMSAGGVNNSSFAAKKLADQIYLGSGHITDFAFYYSTKLDGYYYAQEDNGSRLDGDISNIVSYYRQKSYGITSSTIENQYALNILSGTTFSFLKAYYDYITTGDATVHALEWAGFRFPEINSYLNTRGLSLEVSSSYRFSKDLIFDFAYETITHGDDTFQISPKINYQLASSFPSLANFWLSGDLVYAQSKSQGGKNGLGGGLEASWKPEDHRLSYSLKYNLFNRYTLFGERNSPNLVDANYASQIVGTLKYHY